MLYFFDKSITLRRLRQIDENRSVFSATGTAVGYPTSKQEPSPERIQEYEGQIGNLFSFFVDISCPVREDDQIVYAGVTYSVRDIKTMDFSAFQYKRIIASRGT